MTMKARSTRFLAPEKHQAPSTNGRLVERALLISEIECNGSRRLSFPSPWPSPLARGRIFATLLAFLLLTTGCAGDIPLQGEDSHRHLQNVKRGPDGKGLYALKCRNCHQDTNLPGEDMPPGHPEWHLPPANMPMVFQGKSPAELARQLKDSKRNGGKTLEEILHHIAEDSLVLTGWNPAEGRSKPPLGHGEFAAKMREWVKKGAAIPE